MFSHPPENYVRRVPDLIRDRAIVVLNRAYLPIVIASILLPGVIAFAITARWQAGLTAILWAGLVRIFLVHHTTWSINSVCHLFGTRPYNTSDQSRNNVVCAVLTFGEGWHNNHHAFPASASLGLRWWQVDFGFFVIRILKAFGWVWDVRLPSREQIANHIESAISPESAGDSQRRAV
jgi:stearoyl-CoA desaturase (delta-9 desaturase)